MPNKRVHAFYKACYLKIVIWHTLLLSGGVVWYCNVHRAGSRHRCVWWPQQFLVAPVLPVSACDAYVNIEDLRSQVMSQTKHWLCCNVGWPLGCLGSDGSGTILGRQQFAVRHISVGLWEVTDRGYESRWAVTKRLPGLWRQWQTEREGRWVLHICKCLLFKVCDGEIYRMKGSEKDSVPCWLCLLDFRIKKKEGGICHIAGN